ncbi:hypothetical protein HK097_001770 [Rhizophlyctis rosea]|uniref:Glutathione S-transferase n=1 Tax=Rhizophlyctis rosea TaxID=64517 RepID=A0AAD5S518_9FUNG|nr:hypothetical protein HK097_001770 [Rhizophlyctis rosea]
MTSDKLTFYTNKGCPYAQRVAIALKALNLPHDHVEIDLDNKPEWYPKINPETKVPALAINDTILTESLVIAEYLLEQYPSTLYPTTPLARAQTRFFITLFTDKVNAKTGALQWSGVFGPALDDLKKDQLVKELFAGVRQVNSWLSANSGAGPFATGEKPGFADVALGPFLLRLPVFTAITGVEIPEGVEYDRFHQWVRAVQEWDAAKDTFPGVEVIVGRVQEKIAKVKTAQAQ